MINYAVTIWVASLFIVLTWLFMQAATGLANCTLVSFPPWVVRRKGGVSYFLASEQMQNALDSGLFPIARCRHLYNIVLTLVPG